MPNCFQLFRKGSSEAEILTKVDSEICAFMKVPEDTHRWCYDWYNVIGFGIAGGKPLGSHELRDYVATWTDNLEYTGALVRILGFLEKEYSSNAWVERGKR